MARRVPPPSLADAAEVAAMLTAALQPEADVRSAWLFGSVAAGRARRDSDVDVGVWMDEPCALERLLELNDALQDRTGLPVEVVLLERATPPLARTATNGIPLLTRNESAEIEWVLEKWREAEDWDVFLRTFLIERQRSREGVPGVKLTAGQRAAVMVRVEFARGELGDLAEYGGLNWVAYQADAKSRRNVERIAENVGNATIDIAKILLAAGGSEVPETSREVVAATVPAGLADASQAPDLIRLAQLRNRLSRRYLDYKWELIKWFLDSGRQAVSRWLDRCQQAVSS